MWVDILAAKNRLSQLIKFVRAGEEVIITNRGEPVARLVAIGRTADVDQKSRGRAILEWLDANPLPEHARRSASEIDAAIADERSSWD